jgi:hypothetical protein
MAGVRGIITPSAAAVKGVLLNTTVDMAPGQYGTGTTQEITFARPNSVAGWGRTSLGFIGALFPYALWLDDHASGLSTGQLVTYTHTPTDSLRVITSTQPLRVMLTWTDPPASLSASAQLVNDLDLIVTGPGGSTYRGNASPTGDRVNNVEGVVIANPPVGMYTVTVQAFNVPTATQPYALVVGGPIADDVSISNLQAAAPARRVWASRRLSRRRPLVRTSSTRGTSAMARRAAAIRSGTAMPTRVFIRPSSRRPTASAS